MHQRRDYVGHDMYQQDLKKQTGRVRYTKTQVVRAKHDVRLRNEMVYNHLRFIYRLCLKFYHTYNPPIWDVEEYVGIATEEFIRAIENFNPRKGAHITTYASHKIWSRLSQWYKYNASIIRTIGIGNKDNKPIKVHSFNTINTDHDTNEGDDVHAGSRTGLFADLRRAQEETNNVQTIIDHDHEEYELETRLSRLSPTERRLIEHAYGLFGKRRWKIAPLARTLHVLPSIASAHIATAMSRMKGWKPPYNAKTADPKTLQKEKRWEQRFELYGHLLDVEK